MYNYYNRYGVKSYEMTDDDDVDDFMYELSTYDRRIMNEAMKLGLTELERYNKIDEYQPIVEEYVPKKKEHTPNERVDSMFQRDFREENAQLRAKLSEAADHIKNLEGFIEEAKRGPGFYAYVIKTHGDRVVVSTNDGFVDVLKHPEMDLPKIGDAVIVSSQAGLITDFAEDADLGDLFTIVAHGENWAEISVDGSPRRIVCSIEIEDGDRVLVDANNTIALKNYGKDTTKFSFDGDTGITWDDVGGLEKAKQALKEAIELPNKHPDLFKKYNKHIPKGVMLYGPTGTGKTLLAKAAATSLATIHGTSAKSTGFIYVKGPELLNMWVGNTEAEIRGLFARGRDHFKKNGYPAILFIDEADAILGARGGSSHSSQGTLARSSILKRDGWFTRLWSVRSPCNESSRCSRSCCYS